MNNSETNKPIVAVFRGIKYYERPTLNTLPDPEKIHPESNIDLYKILVLIEKETKSVGKNTFFPMSNVKATRKFLKNYTPAFLKRWGLLDLTGTEKKKLLRWAYSESPTLEMAGKLKVAMAFEKEFGSSWEKMFEPVETPEIEETMNDSINAAEIIYEVKTKRKPIPPEVKMQNFQTMVEEFEFIKNQNNEIIEQNGFIAETLLKINEDVEKLKIMLDKDSNKNLNKLLEYIQGEEKNGN